MTGIEIQASFWLLLPVGVAIAVAYTSTGISGANFWVPVFLLWLGFDPKVAFWLALVAMLFGSASGLVRHARMRTIDYSSAWKLAAASVPAAVAGSLLSPRVPIPLLCGLFALFAFGYGLYVLSTATFLASSPGERDVGRAWAAGGGVLTGLISVGIGALLLPRMLACSRYRHHSEAVGTSLLVVAVTSLSAVLARLRIDLLTELQQGLPEILGALIFVVPGVLLGGQLGPLLARRVDARTMRIYAAVLLLAIAGLMAFRVSTLI